MLQTVAMPPCHSPELMQVQYSCERLLDGWRQGLDGQFQCPFNCLDDVGDLYASKNHWTKSSLIFFTWPNKSLAFESDDLSIWKCRCRFSFDLPGGPHSGHPAAGSKCYASAGAEDLHHGGWASCSSYAPIYWCMLTLCSSIFSPLCHVFGETKQIADYVQLYIYIYLDIYRHLS